MAYVKPIDLDSWKMFTVRCFNEWDADPGYYAIQHTPGLDADQRKRLAIAWCSYYNLGIAADASEYRGRKFWDYLRRIYPTAKRATERRHFRGNAGSLALEYWASHWSNPEALADFICEGSTSHGEIKRQCDRVPQYGTYFTWKWCDLFEVLGYGSPDMAGSERHTPKLPQQGAELIWRMTHDTPDASFCYHELRDTYDMIVAYGRHKKVPPRTTTERRFGLQEAETVCCVYKQMANGSYTYGTRTAKAVKRLSAAESDTAKDMEHTLLRLSPYTREELYAALDSLTKKEK